LTDLNREAAETLLERSGKWVKLALLMHWKDLDKQEAQQLLAAHKGNLRAAVNSF
jgi:N-acetylmuramic acid 6-phosphate etherase